MPQFKRRVPEGERQVPEGERRVPDGKRLLPICRHPLPRAEPLVTSSGPRLIRPAMHLDARTRIAQLLVFVTPSLWAANYVIARLSVGVIEPHALAFFR